MGHSPHSLPHQPAYRRAKGKDDGGAMTTMTADTDLAFAGLARLGDLLGDGRVTPRELTEFYLRRIERLDPRLRAFVSTRPERALAEADAALQRLRAGERGPLLGIPVAIKDNVDLAGEASSHGSRTPSAPATTDSEVVRRMRAAGAIILGRTALCELAAYGHFTASAAFGVTRNPWNTERSPGGSSGGSAAAVAGGLVPIALGSDGGGSIRIPAAFCGLFGLKLTRGRVPLSPLHDHWYGCTVLGGIGRSVLDVALFDDVVSDGRTEFTQAAQTDPDTLRIAYSLRPAIPGVKPSREARAAVEQTVEALRSLGHDVREHHLAHPQLLTTFTPRWAAGIADEAGGHELEPRTRKMAALGRRLHGRPLRRSLAREQSLARRLNAVFDDHDLVLTPTTAAPPPPADVSAGAGAFRTFNQASRWVCYTPTWNYVGQPAASIPAGFDDSGLPLAVQLAAPPNAERTIISLAAQLEKARPWTTEVPPGVNDDDAS
jgi:amidase